MRTEITQQRVNRVVRHIERRYTAANAWKGSEESLLVRVRSMVAKTVEGRVTNRQWDDATRAERERLENRLHRVSVVAERVGLGLPRIEARQLFINSR